MRVLKRMMSMKGNNKTPNNNNNNNNSDSCKLVVLGRTGVGKSAIVVRFLTKRFIWEYDPTIECAYRHQTNIDEEPATMEILDTAGLEFTQYFEGHIRWGEGFVLVYSVTDRRSFEDISVIKKHLDEIRKPRNMSCIIVGNKSDLEHERKVSVEEGERLSADSACAFFETSARDGGMEITECFHELYREVKRRKMMDGKPRRRSSAAQVKQVLNKMFTKIQTG